jgi:hypothetical protein
MLLYILPGCSLFAYDPFHSKLHLVLISPSQLVIAYLEILFQERYFSCLSMVP